MMPRNMAEKALVEIENLQGARIYRTREKDFGSVEMAFDYELNGIAQRRIVSPEMFFLGYGKAPDVDMVNRTYRAYHAAGRPIAITARSHNGYMETVAINRAFTHFEIPIHETNLLRRLGLPHPG